MQLHADPAQQTYRIGAAADLLRVPAVAADRAGAVPRSNWSDAETAPLLALIQRRRPG